VSGNVCDRCGSWGTIGRDGTCWTCNHRHDDDPHAPLSTARLQKPVPVRERISVVRPTRAYDSAMKPWQHAVIWPPTRRVLDLTKSAVAHRARNVLDLLDPNVYTLLETRMSFGMLEAFVEIVGSGVTVIVTQDHDSGDE
jgi:hypothetical protein